MPQPHSADLRERVLLAGEAGLPPAMVAERFGIGLSRVYLWHQQARGGSALCQAAWRRSGAEDRGGGRGDPADAGGRAQ
jgi:transposase